MSAMREDCRREDYKQGRILRRMPGILPGRHRARCRRDDSDQPGSKMSPVGDDALQSGRNPSLGSRCVKLPASRYDFSFPFRFFRIFVRTRARKN